MASVTQAVSNSVQSIRKVIFASSAGTVIEWYDFYIFGSLSTVMASKFYHTGTDIGDLIAWLSTFAIGFMVRPFGALFFGRIGDLVGRKFTYLLTISIMAGSTMGVGLLPTADTLGAFAGIILITLRILQGLALGGQYGGAATFVAEHAPHGKRGFYTSWIQTTATLGLFLSLGIILATRKIVGEADFSEWGWRIPFLFSVALVFLSLWIRSSLKESPLFTQMKATKTVSKNPLKESFANKFNRKWVLIALFGATMGQGVVWYTGQFYALFYLQKIFKVTLVDSNFIVGAAVLLATPLFIFFGWLSDRIGRKPIMMAGMLLAVLTYYPIYGAMAAFAPTDPGQHFLFAYQGYNQVALTFLVFIQVVYVTMVYGPIAAFLVELFPTKIRYTSMSLPYHLGNGVFGGLVPILGLAWINATGNNFAGLWWPMAIAATCFIFGMIFVRETKDVDITDETTTFAHQAEAAQGKQVKGAMPVMPEK
ncbi:putative arabinose efflux permease, MFS family [Dehalogenimonas formicexedens]|uniref:Putative arabinose efflux permease, MFS family n=1 Tax=Dehalogenimonas formicexedens TaxID=1839801 RepID=A0A1P8F6A2_9CHLR|nr:MFS transporter [Dehalogenimonas formicexedens]APV44017.1 putative arabinose efflux permease, MFS family [Dehalogenimonas formicexedens]